MLLFHLENRVIILLLHGRDLSLVDLLQGGNLLLVSMFQLLDLRFEGQGRVGELLLVGFFLGSPLFFLSRNVALEALCFEFGG